MHDHAAPVATVNPALVPESAEVTTAFLIGRPDTGETEFVSPGFESITGYPAGSVVGEVALLARMVHPDHLDSAAAFVTAFWAGRPAQHETRIIRADGETRWIRAVTTPLPADGGVLRTVTSVEDITERVSAVEEAREAAACARAAHEAKSASIARMSHELRTPLNAVIGFGQLLERRVTDPDDLSSVQYIVSSGRHLLALIDDVLDIARIGAGSMTLSPEPLDVESLVDEVVPLVGPTAARSDVSVAVEGGPVGLRLLGDRLRLVQVLQNLLTDAIRFNRPGGHVWVSWSDLDGASVTVRDDGAGIAPELRDRLFTPADRMGAASVAATGSGVGLSVTRALVELMGGTLRCESVPGAGTSFSVTLPPASRRRDAVDVLSIPPQHVAPSTTLLYIEDNQPNVRVVSSLLRLRPGWQLVHTPRGRAGLGLARTRRPDLVLLDLHLPDCFGLSILESLKADPATADIPVVVLSADASSTQVDRLLQAGAAQYLTKPLDLHEVLMLLDGITADQRTRMVDA